MSVLFIVKLKCMLAMSHAALGESQWVCRQDRQTDGRQTVTLCFWLDVASVIFESSQICCKNTQSDNSSICIVSWDNKIVCSCVYLFATLLCKL